MNPTLWTVTIMSSMHQRVWIIAWMLVCLAQVREGPHSKFLHKILSLYRKIQIQVSSKKLSYVTGFQGLYLLVFVLFVIVFGFTAL